MSHATKGSRGGAGHAVESDCLRSSQVRRASGQSALFVLVLAVLAFALTFGDRGYGALYNNLGCLAYTRSALESGTPVRDAALMNARRLFEEALKWNAGSTRANHNLGLTRLALGRTRAAQQSFERAIELTPHDASANHQLGPIYYELGREDDAIEAWQRAGAAPWLVGQGLRCRSGADEACAERYYLLALEVHPNHAEALYQLGMLYADTGRPAEAAEAYRNALNSPALRRELYHLIQAHLYVLEERWDDAIASYKHVTESNPEKADAYLQIAAILHREYRDYSAAIEWALAALEVAPGRVSAYLRLAYIHRDLLNYAEAERWYEQAITAAGDSRVTRARAFAGLSRVALAQGDLERAMAAAEKAVTARGDVTDYVLLGDLCTRLKLDDCAIASYTTALGLDHTNERARSQLERLRRREP